MLSLVKLYVKQFMWCKFWRITGDTLPYACSGPKKPMNLDFNSLPGSTYPD